MQLYWKTAASVSRHEPENYVRSLQVDVRCFDENTEREYLVARVALDHVLWGDAIADGESLFRICDNDSQGLHELHVILTNGTNNIRDDLEIPAPVSAVIFVHNAVFHPDVRPYRIAVLDVVFNLLGEHTLAVMWREVGDLTEREQVELGLARVAGTNLVFRHNALSTPYAELNPEVWTSTSTAPRKSTGGSCGSGSGRGASNPTTRHESNTYSTRATHVVVPRTWLMRLRCNRNESTPPHARTASATCRAVSAPPHPPTTVFTNATFASTAERSDTGDGAAVGTEAAITSAAFAAARAGSDSGVLSFRGGFTTGLDSAFSARFLSSLLMLWTVVRMDFSGAVTPYSRALRITSSADSVRSSFRMERTTELMTGADMECPYMYWKWTLATGR
ncbi:hypothetical protein VT84_33760 [Gemmata sp. SH-PL17]|uniref:hypothetical protein n=1 Tax=Gemmata sp. SH-PL17 TaxID=1630693 RepID=UPI0004B110ED|nr:hypothetical protein [Gemmata sp. SH-PL17]AMV29410.1 hypothetical protein VT84_33760 [Gemmata sp. SH-PL17]